MQVQVNPEIMPEIKALLDGDKPAEDVKKKDHGPRTNEAKAKAKRRAAKKSRKINRK